MLAKFKKIHRLVRAVGANLVYGFPSRGMVVIGVTGTDGKTTTASLIYHILKSSGRKVAMITTVGAYIGDKKYETGFHVTTPSSFTLQKYINQAKGAGCNYLVLEVTSHALDQNRTFGIKFDIAVLTNITHEYLDYHKTYENYLAAKLKLLKRSQTLILNQDDESFELIKPGLLDKEIIPYSLKTNTTFKTNLLGEFNKLNCLAAATVARKLLIKDRLIQKALSTFKPPPGRQQLIYNKLFKVMIDFAHTPNAFAKSLPAFKKLATGRLIHLFGSAGARDKSKRPLMGEESAKFADIIILTAEDPRGEKVEQINLAIKKGIGQRKQVVEIPDREEAIKYAFSIAKKGDVVVLTGKGHEQSMNLGQGEIPWSDTEIALKYLKN